MQKDSTFLFLVCKSPGRKLNGYYSMMKTIVRAVISWTLQLNNMQNRLILDQKTSKFPSNSKFYDYLFLGLLTKGQEKKKSKDQHTFLLCAWTICLCFGLERPFLRQIQSHVSHSCHPLYIFSWDGHWQSDTPGSHTSFQNHNSKHHPGSL